VIWGTLKIIGSAGAVRIRGTLFFLDAMGKWCMLLIVAIQPPFKTKSNNE
jgi:hypothetical protein